MSRDIQTDLINRVTASDRAPVEDAPTVGSCLPEW